MESADIYHTRQLLIKLMILFRIGPPTSLSFWYRDSSAHCSYYVKNKEEKEEKRKWKGEMETLFVFHAY